MARQLVNEVVDLQLLDTSALLNGVLPTEFATTYHVLLELDRLKDQDRTRGRQRKAIRWILQQQPKVYCVEQPDADSSLLQQLRLNPDMELVTQDVQLYLRQTYLGFKQQLVSERLDCYIHDPIRTLEVGVELSGKSIALEYPAELEGKYQLLKYGENTRIAFLHEGKATFVNPKAFSIGETKVQQLNLEQRILQQQIEEPKVQLITQIGTAGCGKTYIALQTQLKLVLEGKYQCIIAAVPPVPLGGEDRYGFLPGTIQEKTVSQFSGIADNLKCLLGTNEGQKVIDEQVKCTSALLQLQQFSNVRGRSIKNSIIIVDEQQNMSRLEAKTFLTRLDHGSKIILLGDIEQIDTGKTGPEDNGLIATQLQFKDVPGQIHVALKRCCRTDIQQIQSERL